MGYPIVLSTWARANLRDTVRYISIDSPDRALAFGKFLIQKTELLAQFTELGRMVPEFRDPALREIIVRSYRVVYRVKHSERRAEIIRYWHGARASPELPATA